VTGVQRSAQDPPPVAGASTQDAVVTKLHAWITSQPLWRQQAFRYLLAQPNLEDKQRAEVRDLLCIEAGYSGAKTHPLPKPVDKAEIQAPPGVAGTNRLHRLFSLINVNALPEDTELRFNPDGLTIVYGHNGSGKSSYVRSLKRLCRSVDRDRSILPNVLKRGTRGGKPTAHIEWAPPGEVIQAKEFDLSDTALQTPIAAISVFDARCAEIYVDRENQIAFVPSLIRVLVRLADEQIRLQQEVEEMIGRARSRRPDFGTIAAGTKARTLVDSLNATTSETTLLELAKLSDEEVARRDHLDLALTAAQTGAGERQQAQLRAQALGARELAKALRTLSEVFDPLRVEGLKTAVTELQMRRDAVKLAAKDAFAGEQLLGVGSEAWRALWEAARTFYGSAHAEHAPSVAVAFPDTSGGADCPLCFQELDERARDRFQRFEAFIKSDAEDRATEAERALSVELARFPEQIIFHCRTPFFESLAATDAKLHARINEWLLEASKLREGLMTAAARGDELPEVALSSAPTAELDDMAKAREEEAEGIALAVKPGEREALAQELAELNARRALASRLDEVTAWRAELGQIAALDKAKAALTTQGISLKQRALTEQLVTEAMKTRLRQELDAFGFTHLAFELKPRGEHGTTMVQLRLRDAPSQELASILSDGERRALALAFFLAEVSTAESPGGIVLDDPVSSLDQERRQEIAKRIAAESATRQVILFTHDLAFLFHVQAEAETVGLEAKVQHVWRDGENVGRTAPDAPFEASRVKERIAWLERTLQAMPKEGEFKSDDERRMHVSSWYRHLRDSWERAVEEIVFNETIQRFTPHVQTQRLQKVTITPEMLAELEAGMTNCSRRMHDQPAAAGGGFPSRIEMRDDLDSFKVFCKQHRKN
jgi:energy-coupling factor transporter ATP-binding protein EcfA2